MQGRGSLAAILFWKGHSHPAALTQLFAELGIKSEPKTWADLEPSRLLLIGQKLSDFLPKGLYCRVSVFLI